MINKLENLSFQIIQESLEQGMGSIYAINKEFNS